MRSDLFDRRMSNDRWQCLSYYEVAEFAGNVGTTTGCLGLACASAFAFSFTDVQDIVLHVLLCATLNLPNACRSGFLRAHIWKARAPVIWTK